LKGACSFQPPGTSGSGEAYESVFVRRVHMLLGQGYSRLRPIDFANEEEEEITHRLAQSIDEYRDETSAPEWTRFFSVHPEPRVRGQGRKGKRRWRIDIRIDSSQVRPCTRICFEAKRLGPGHSVATYLGKDGLQRFIDGRYASDAAWGGMLGYVQAGTPAEWAVKIEQSLAENPSKFCLLNSSPWRSVRLASELSCTHQSGHDRKTVGSPIEIYHILLLFN
jgi:hypothetical protein